jgi:phosphopantothenoylcysteine decarboxylase/phosphopantothenate--cysteine ligase
LNLDYLKDIRLTLGDELDGKRIALCVTGSVSAYRAVDLARLLIRHGADVVPVVTQGALKIITKELLTWATGNQVVAELTGAVEHVGLAGRGSSRVNAVLVAPCTANTLGKIAHGIDDTPVTSVVSVALGSGLPVIIVPAMHEPMYNNPLVKANVENLKRIGVVFVEPTVEEGKAKFPPAERVLFTLSPIIGRAELRGMRVLVTAGPTREHIDPIRVITNPSSGKMGYSIAEKAKLMGAEVTLVTGPTQLAPPPVDHVYRVESTAQMLDAVLRIMSQNQFDLAFFAAAPSDYAPHVAASQKISTREVAEFDLKLRSTPKIIGEVTKTFTSCVVVGFKAEYGLSKEALVEAAITFKHEYHVDVVVANDAAKPGAAFEADTNEGLIVGLDDEVIHIEKTSKPIFAQRILKYVAGNLSAFKAGKTGAKAT